MKEALGRGVELEQGEANPFPPDITFWRDSELLRRIAQHQMRPNAKCKVTGQKQGRLQVTWASCVRNRRKE